MSTDKINQILQKRLELMYAIVNQYGETHNFTIKDIENLVPFNKEYVISIEEENIDESKPLCMARKSSLDSKNCQCSKRKSDGDFCKTHSKEINKYCRVCSKIKGFRVIHQYRWQINGRIDETEYTECFKKYTEKKENK
jgi:hypothetical protein